jgi:hypothetical protein
VRGAVANSSLLVAESRLESVDDMLQECPRTSVERERTPGVVRSLSGALRTIVNFRSEGAIM